MNIISIDRPMTSESIFNYPFFKFTFTQSFYTNMIQYPLNTRDIFNSTLSSFFLIIPSYISIKCYPGIIYFYLYFFIRYIPMVSQRFYYISCNFIVSLYTRIGVFNINFFDYCSNTSYIFRSRFGS